MKYYTFLQQFHAQIVSGTKHSTIRQKPKVNVGERFTLRYWTEKPYRSKMGTLGSAVCTCVVEEFSFNLSSDGAFEILLNTDDWISYPWLSDLDYVASIEGFDSASAMFSYFEKHHGLPFCGTLTSWDPKSFIPGEGI